MGWGEGRFVTSASAMRSITAFWAPLSRWPSEERSVERSISIGSGGTNSSPAAAAAVRAFASYNSANERRAVRQGAGRRAEGRKGERLGWEWIGNGLGMDWEWIGNGLGMDWEWNGLGWITHWQAQHETQHEAQHGRRRHDQHAHGRGPGGGWGQADGGRQMGRQQRGAQPTAAADSGVLT